MKVGVLSPFFSKLPLPQHITVTGVIFCLSIYTLKILLSRIMAHFYHQVLIIRQRSFGFE